MNNILTIQQALTIFRSMCGDSTYLAIGSNYIRTAPTKRTTERCEVVAFNATMLEKSADLRSWFSDWCGNKCRMTSKLGLRLARIGCLWLGEYAVSDIDSVITDGENRGDGLEKVLTQRVRSRHATNSEDVNQLIDIFTTCKGIIRPVQCKCSISGSSVNISKSTKSLIASYIG